ncbi:hypothetical protein CGRA01v4_11961 [Colletotrichum graminicola]|uniref:Nucleoside phosphorylase domain-containing protein n=1 Tax=Colletotrichum graminicola (strain M1.001 / M2 / FGSC 10212) TaxID=645133 RepID=E3QBH7_COLGM|nr:uncharacterized protein GLRG_03460 [Colletotrichum graminicola M1.001]EFQ28316.1 hypothetical protein GLRG_03460 [Colletotrichum graminicola M1.001]WDK20674.1 hypothetical protein CGRA01v4_11961 [Colletotrichum graminicola]
MVAANCRNSFPDLKLALVVGICGGVPFYDKEMQEIILGDVTVSEDFVQYDVGRRYSDKFEIRESAWSVTGRPPPEPRGLINKLKSPVYRRRTQEKTCLHLQTLREELGSEAELPVAPVVHFGYIVRADQVMKSGEHRDNIVRETGAIAFEMEDAGPQEQNVADYAAATAAAYAKALLQEW